MQADHQRTLTLTVLTILSVAATLLSGCDRKDDGRFATYNGKSTSEPAIEADAMPPVVAPRPEIDAGPVVAAKPDEFRSQLIPSAVGGGPALAFLDSQAVRAEATGAAATANGKTPVEQVIGKREIKLLVPEKRFRRIRGVLHVSYDDIDLLRVLNMDPVPANAVDHFPDWLKNLNGKKIRIRGFMFPTFEEEISRFKLARDNDICCFRRDPRIYDVFPVKLREGTTVHYIEGRPFDVVGTFQIKPYYEDGYWFRLYQIVDAQVIN